MSVNTRDQFLSAATQLFAEKGFYGASIASIARELELTKQALLHHFSTKEKLYGEVLQRISSQLMQETSRIVETVPDPISQLEELILAHYRNLLANQDAARLIMRELLDNEQRADKAGNWYLKNYLELLIDTVQSINGGIARYRAFALIYQLLGAVHYFAVSQPTLRVMFGESLLEGARNCYEQELRRLIQARLGK